MKTQSESFGGQEGATSARRSGQVIEYTGYVPPLGGPIQIDEVQPNISPEEFFEKYVSQRKPVLFKGHLLDKEWKGSLWTNKYLKSRAQNAQVIVERRGVNKGASFGLNAPKEDMHYGEFVDNVVSDNDRLYLTTQDLERFEEDLDMFDMPKSIMAEPLKSLQGDIPVRPKVFGHLVPYQISLWQGIANEGTSSGLHHDFHDNLYILMRGKKRFRLFAPSALPHMKTVGKVAKIHKNGLIVYRSSPRDASIAIRPDGVPYAFLAKMKREFAEAELTEAEEELKDLMDSNARQLSEEEKQAEIQRLQGIMAECEDRIDLAMEDMLDSEIVSDSETSGSEVELVPDDHAHSAADSQEDCNGEEEPQVKRRRTDSVGGGGGCSADRDQPHLVHVDYNDQRILPDNFCDIKLPTHTDDPDEVFQSCPKLREMGSIHCEIQAGEMLYLPASWFHEVTSYSTGGETSPDKSSKDKGHLALNYWMFPPDNNQWDLPYWDDFWERRWAMHQEEQQATEPPRGPRQNGNGETHHHGNVVESPPKAELSEAESVAIKESTD